MADGADVEHGEAQQGQHGDDQRELQRLFDAEIVQPDEQHVSRRPEQRLHLHRRTHDGGPVRADEEHDHRRGHYVLDVFRQPGEKSAPRPEGGAGERVGAARVRHGRAHLGEREGQPEIHDGDENGGDQHAAPAAGGEAEVPTGEVSRDHRANAERPQEPHAGVAFEAARFEVCVVDLLIRYAARLLLHDKPPAGSRHPSTLAPGYASRGRWSCPPLAEPLVTHCQSSRQLPH